MSKKQTLTLNRNGEFSVAVKGGFHCGVKEKGYPNDPIRVKYEVAVECTTKLDKRGFLFEQLGVQNFFEGIVKTNKSCEKLTKWCARKLIERIMMENPTCKVLSISVKLSPSPYQASMTFKEVA